MTVKEWYATEYNGHLTKKDLFLILQNPEYRPDSWVPQWNRADYLQGELDNQQLVELPMDPRTDRHWRNSDWDDVLLPQWWRWVVYQYKYNCFHRIFEYDN